jgi:predicted MFS family arabinose efflux permease
MGLATGRSVSGWDFIPAFLVLGTGLGLVASQINEIEQSAVSKEEAGETSGLNYTSQNLGASLGTAVAGALIASFLVMQGPITTTAQRKAVAADMILLAVLAAFGFLGTLGLPKRKAGETIGTGVEA